MSADGLDIFVQSLDSEGNFRWARAMGGPDTDIGEEIAISTDGSIHVTGQFYETVDFNPGLGEYPITSNGSRDFFVVKLSPCEPTASTETVIACNSYTWIDGETYTEDNNSATVTLENMGGCDSVVTLDLTIIELENGISSVGATLTVDDPDAAYQWLDCNADYAEISGETSVAFTATEDGVYAVRIAQGECVDTSACITIEGVGITQNQLGNIQVYPNPTHGQVILDGLYLKEYFLEIYTVTGEKIMAKQIKNEQKLN